LDPTGGQRNKAVVFVEVSVSDSLFGYKIKFNCSALNVVGGYNGPLNGHQMRVKFPSDADAKFSLYTGEDNFTKRGSIYEFLKLVAKANNFGMYSRHTKVETNSTSTSMPSTSPTVLPTTSQMFNESSQIVDTYDEVSRNMDLKLVSEFTFAYPKGIQSIIY